MATHSCTFAWRIPWMTLVGCSPWGREEWDTTEHLHFHFSLSCIGEGSGGPLQCSCLENPRDGGAWWAAVYGVTESDTTEVTKQQQQHCCRFRPKTRRAYPLLFWQFPVCVCTTTVLCSIFKRPVTSADPRLRSHVVALGRHYWCDCGKMETI